MRFREVELAARSLLGSISFRFELAWLFAKVLAMDTTKLVAKEEGERGSRWTENMEHQNQTMITCFHDYPTMEKS